MSGQNQAIITHKLNQYIHRLLPLDNKDLLVILSNSILCVNQPEYRLGESLKISFENNSIDGVCVLKKNHVLIKIPQNFIVIELFNNNTEYRVISTFNLYPNIRLRYQKMVPIDGSKILLNVTDSIIVLEEGAPYIFQTEKKIFLKKSLNSILPIRKNEIISSCCDEKKVIFIDTLKGRILSLINNIHIYIEDVDSFCRINKNVVAMGGDLRDGIYFFDINRRELIFQYKENWRGYNSLLRLGNNKFLGESYEGRCYGESDDDSEDLYCTHFFEYNEKEQKIKIYKYSQDRVYDLKRINLVKFKGIGKIAYSSHYEFYIENL